MIYTKGTAAVTQNSQTVTGTGTRWSKRIHAGDVFQLEAGGSLYLVAEVSSDTSLLLAAKYAETTDAAADYTIVSDFSRYFSVPYPRNQDIEKASVLKRSTRRIDVLLDGLNDRIFNVEYPPGSVVDIVSTPGIDTVYIALAPGDIVVDPATSTPEIDTVFIVPPSSSLVVEDLDSTPDIDPVYAGAALVTADAFDVKASANLVTADGFYAVSSWVTADSTVKADSDVVTADGFDGA
jgi:hypothetical protein